LADANTSFVLSPDSEFFRFFDSATLPSVEQARGPGPAPAEADSRAALQPGLDGTAVELPSDGEATSAPQPPAKATTLE
jgi:hypothetical protein